MIDDDNCEFHLISYDACVLIDLFALIENKQLKSKMNRLEEDQRDVMHRQQAISYQSHPVVVLDTADDLKDDLQCGDIKNVLQPQQTSFSPHEQGFFEFLICLNA